MSLPHLVLGTQNPGKVEELRQALAGRCVVQGLTELGKPPLVEEDGQTYRENAEKKARQYFLWAKMPVLADDSGLEVDVLGGDPGVHSAYFGGVDISWPERWAVLHKALKPFPQDRWSAKFRCVLCYYDGKDPIFFEGITPGKVLPAPLGNEGFGYDPIIWSEDLKMGFGEATLEAKNRVSHRARAIKSFSDWLDHRGTRS